MSKKILGNVFGKVKSGVRRAVSFFARGTKKQKILKLLTLVVFVAALMGGAYFAGRDDGNKQVSTADCGQIMTEVDSSMDNFDNPKAHDLLLRYLSSCSDSADKKTAIKYNARLAATSFEMGDKDGAKKYADKMLKTADSMDAKDRLSIGGYAALANHMSDIQKGRYGGMGALNAD